MSALIALAMLRLLAQVTLPALGTWLFLLLLPALVLTTALSGI